MAHVILLFCGLIREKNERTFVWTGGGYLGNDVDCDFPATRAGRGSRLHLLAFCRGERHHDDCPAGTGTFAQNGDARSPVLYDSGLLRVLL
ncbi:hypothetical protein D3C85_1221650 [compost metagenome]